MLTDATPLPAYCRNGVRAHGSPNARIASAPGGHGTPTMPRRVARSWSTGANCSPCNTPPACARGPRRRLPVVPELELDAEILLPQERHGLLKVVARRRGDADLIALNGRLHFLELRVLDRGGDLLRGI